MNARTLISLCLAGVLGACTALGPDYQRPASTLPDAFAGAAPGDAGAPAVTPDWWTLYRDPQLDALVAAARSRNADVRIAIAQLEEAEAALREAHATLFPQVDLGAQGTRSRISTLAAQPVFAGIPVARTDFRAVASTAFELDFWGRLRRGEEAVRAQLMSTRFARDVTDLTLVGAVTQAYFLLRSLDAQRSVTRETLALREESLAMARSRARGGVVSDLDVAQAEGARADAAAQLVEIERQRAQVQHQLANLTAQPNLAIAPGDLRGLPVPPPAPPGLPSALLDRRPDVRSAEQNLAAANARIGIAKAAMMPSISLTGSLGGQSRDLSDLLAGGARIWSLGLGLTLPIFDAGRLAARTEQAEARQRQALAAYQKAAENAFREVADGLVNAERSAAAERELQARADAARRASVLARKRYEAGYSAYLEVLDAQRTLNDAEVALVRSRQSRLSYSVDLMKALGGGWTAP